MGQSDTIERILDAASVLFAERGFAETSLRTITSSAGVNLAAVNYHFGSKKALIQAVFARFLTPFCARLEAELNSLENDAQEIDTQSLVDCLFRSLVGALEEQGESPEQFMRLVGMAYSQSQEHLRHFIIQEYSGDYLRFTALLKQAMPEVEPAEFYWRLYFMLGASIFTLSSFDSITATLKADLNTESSLQDAISLLVPAVTGMLTKS